MKLEGIAELTKCLGFLHDDFSRLLVEDGIKVLARVHASQTRRRFSTKKGPSGRWKAWSDSYAATRGSEHSLLINDGALLGSLGDEAIEQSADGYTYSTDVPYAGMVQDKRQFMGFGGRSEIDTLDHALSAWSKKTLKRHGIA